MIIKVYSNEILVMLWSKILGLQILFYFIMYQFKVEGLTMTYKDSSIKEGN